MAQNLKFRPKFEILSNISLFRRKLNFLQNFNYFFPQIALCKTNIFSHNFGYFLRKRPGHPSQESMTSWWKSVAKICLWRQKIQKAIMILPELWCFRPIILEIRWWTNYILKIFLAISKWPNHLSTNVVNSRICKF